MAILRGTIVNNNARTQLADFIQPRLAEGSKDRLGDDSESALRAGLSSTILASIVTSRSIIGGTLNPRRNFPGSLGCDC